MKICQHCSAELADDAKFCPECGNRVTLVCSCGQPLTGNEKFCPSCGSPTTGGISGSKSPVGFAQYSQGGFSNYGIPDVKQNKQLVIIPIGEKIANQYVVKRKLGQGGFGAVYEVFDEIQERPKAIKVITLENKAVLESLKTEFESRENITDMKHVIRGYDFSKINYMGDDVVIYPMELADKSFRDWLNETKSEKEKYFEEGIELFRQTCLGVKALHDAELIHLDLKPENILLVKDRKNINDDKNNWAVKITDFGLSRGTGKLQGNIGVGGDGIGTPWYMSPEQVFAARQKDINVSADIYALGVILFELLDGDKPFDGTPEAVKRKHKEVEPPKLKNVPDRLQELVYACLQKAPEKRPANIDEVLEKLNEFIAGSKEKSTKEMLEQERKNEARKALIIFIEAMLIDGVLDQEERKQVLQKANDLGIPKNEAEKIILEQLNEKGAVEKIICTKCGFELKPHWKKCPKCKTPAPLPETSNDASELKCPNCGMPVKPHWKKCPKCKTILK